MSVCPVNCGVFVTCGHVCAILNNIEAVAVDCVVVAVIVDVADVVVVVCNHVNAVCGCACHAVLDNPLVNGVFATDEGVDVVGCKIVFCAVGSIFICGDVVEAVATKFGEADVDADFIFPQIELD